MAEKKYEVGEKVSPKVSVRKGQIGTVIAIGKNAALPVTVVFDDKVEWDYKEEELEIREMTEEVKKPGSLYRGKLVIGGKERQIYEHADLYFYYDDEGQRVHINSKEFEKVNRTPVVAMDIDAADKVDEILAEAEEVI